MARTSVVDISPRNRQAGEFAFEAPQPVPSGLVQAKIEMVVDEADKLAVGKQLTLASYFSMDGGATWTLGNQTVWTSYGPNGLTVALPDGAQIVNPNPTLHIGLANRAGQHLRATLVLPQALRVGTIVTVADETGALRRL